MVLLTKRHGFRLQHGFRTMRFKPVSFSVRLLSVLLLFSLSGLTTLQAAGAKKSILREYTFGDQQKFRAGFNGRTIIVQLQPRKGDGAYRFASWTLRDWKNNFQNIKKYNRKRPLLANHYVQIPFKALNDEMQSMVLQAVFSNDSSEEDGWAHRVMFDGETISLIAGVFARDDIPPQKLIEYNQLSHQGRHLKVGDTVMIPWKWVKEGIGLRPVSVREPLTMGNRDYDRGYAYYSLKKGESLYSAVVVRFTGRTLAEDVNRMAAELLKLNDIRDEHYIPVGKNLKIPIEWISEEYLILRKKTQEVPEAEDEAEKKVVIRKDEPVHIILDMGHGGIDPGAIFGSKRNGYLIFEDETVYDIGLRMEELLKKENYIVHRTLVDPDQPKPVTQLATEKDEDEYVAVSPAYNVLHAGVGVNMRIFLVNSIYQELLRRKVPRENILLLSLHCDALHQSLRGVTVYYPDFRLRSASFKLTHSVYRRRSQYRRELHFANRDNIRATRVSSEFGKTIINRFKQAELETHSDFAVRGYYYRRSKRTLPGILRYSQIPASVLVEVGNLNNPLDRADLLKADYRQKVAATLVDSINHHYRQG